MMLSTDDEAFDPAPLKKRRRLNRTVLDTSEAENEEPDANAPTIVVSTKSNIRKPRKTSTSDTGTSKTARQATAPERKPRGRPRKPSPDLNLVKVRKHRIVINEAKPVLRDTFCTQAPPPSSCPWRVRGPIWQRQAPNSVLVPLNDDARHGSLSSSQSAPVGATQVAVDVTGVGKSGHAYKVNAQDASDSEGNDSDDEAFEPVREATPPSLGSPAAGSETTGHGSEDGSASEMGSEDERETFERAEERPNVNKYCIQPLHRTTVALRSEMHGHDMGDVVIPQSSMILQQEVNSPYRPKQDSFMLPAVPSESRSSAHAQQQVQQSQRQAMEPKLAVAFDMAKELEDLPSDAFASSSSSPVRSPGKQLQQLTTEAAKTSGCKAQNLAAPLKGLRQMTLFGDAAQRMSAASQANKAHNWPMSNRIEPPTHHKLNDEALTTLIYPTNLGTIRDYQYNIVMRGLYHNLLVALPTGLGKTFIAATIMLNWYRWTADAQIVFVAPTKPLVSQQVEACLGIAGIPRSQTSMLTGGIAPGLRAEEWTLKRVFFMTPQTIVNDLKTGICDPKRIVLLVVDEAHRATGAYAYVEVVALIRRFNPSFRVLGLTATPGSSVETVQQVIDGLDISRVEIRTEFSLDIRQYVHAKDTDTQTFDVSEEVEFISTMFCDAVRPVLLQLVQQNGYWSKDPMAITVFGLRQQQQKWNASEPGRKAHVGIRMKVNKIFAVLIKLANSVELIKFHGIRPFFKGMKKFCKETEESPLSVKYEKEILDSVHLNNMMGILELWHKREGFVGHPKLEYLQDVVLRHFTDANERRELASDKSHVATRIMVFVQYRSSAEVITEFLERHTPLVKPHLFVGQAASKDSEGMDQGKQQEVINKFKDGTYNVLVATSIGEEGLDIGEIDLIVCYDSSASPIRMLQRMGRTGRKRAGNIVVLLMKGKEENSFAQSKDNYEKMQKKISAGSEFTFHDDRSTRIVPRDVQPAVEKKVIEIPLENAQGGLPEPTKKGKRAPKRPPKKFHMPDGVRTGFVSASRIDDDDDSGSEIRSTVKNGRKTQAARDLGPELEPKPSLDDVALTVAQEKDLQRRYQNVPDMTESTVRELRLHMYPDHQRTLTGTRYVKHTAQTKTTVKALKAIHNTDLDTVQRFRDLAENVDVDALCKGYDAISSAEVSEMSKRDTAVNKKTAKSKEITRPHAPKNKTKSKVEPVKTAPLAKRARNKPAKPSSDPMEAPPSSAPPTSPRLHLASQGISLGSSDTDGEDEQDLPDSELAGFIVDSDEGEASANSMDSEDDDDDIDDLALQTRRTAAPASAAKERLSLFTSQELAIWKSSSEEVHAPSRKADTGRKRNADNIDAMGKPSKKRSRRVIDDCSSE